jgi:hypothetical protein
LVTASTQSAVSAGSLLSQRVASSGPLWTQPATLDAQAGVYATVA